MDFPTHFVSVLCVAFCSFLCGRALNVIDGECKACFWEAVFYTLHQQFICLSRGVIQAKRLSLCPRVNGALLGVVNSTLTWRKVRADKQQRHIQRGKVGEIQWETSPARMRMPGDAPAQRGLSWPQERCLFKLTPTFPFKALDLRSNIEKEHFLFIS